MGFVAGDLLHDVKVVDGGEEVAEGKDFDWFFGEGRSRIAQFIDFGAGGTV